MISMDSPSKASADPSANAGQSRSMQSPLVSALLQPILDQPPGDRILARPAEIRPIFVIEQPAPAVPAGILQFRAVDSDVAGAGRGVEAQHDRGRKRPGLRRMIGHAIDLD